MNPVIRVSAGMLTGHGNPRVNSKGLPGQGFKVSPETLDLMARINRAVASRLSGRSLNPSADLEDGLEAALALIRLRETVAAKVSDVKQMFSSDEWQKVEEYDDWESYFDKEVRRLDSEIAKIKGVGI